MSVVDVVIISCGVPRRSMGWYHATQLLDGRCPSARLTDIVESYLLGPGADSPSGQAFAEWKHSTASGVRFHQCVGDLPALEPGRSRLALVSGRTVDNPSAVRSAIKAGCTHVYLEKPGAASVEELQSVADFAKANGVPVWMGYNKNVSGYIAKARAFACHAGDEVSSISLVHHNCFKPEELDECFERCNEGIVKNMCCHELALLASFFGVSVETVASIDADRAGTRRETRGEFTDYRCFHAEITTKAGNQFALKVDRCGAENYGAAEVKLKNGFLFRSKMMNEAMCEAAAAAEAKYPGLLAYFYQQDVDYAALKELCAQHAATGAPGHPDRVPTIDAAIAALKLAELLHSSLERLWAQWQEDADIPKACQPDGGRSFTHGLQKRDFDPGEDEDYEPALKKAKGACLGA